MFGFKEFFGKPQRYLAHKDGRAVSVCISSKDLDSLMLIFERRIEQSDVVNANLFSSFRMKVPKTYIDYSGRLSKTHVTDVVLGISSRECLQW